MDQERGRLSESSPGAAIAEEHHRSGLLRSVTVVFYDSRSTLQGVFYSKWSGSDDN